ncbi:MAG: CPBP family intramembrane metalloprotease [Planctomycetes bacterium]|nr:CPBP family intramembrane metalloprotease [Planctomycetota bacterium]
MNDPFANPRPWWEDDYVWRPQEADATDDVSAPVERRLPEPLPDLVECWRCGKQVEEELSRCPYCRASLQTARPRRGSRRRTRPEDVLEEDEVGAYPRMSSALGPLLGFFTALLVVSLIQGLIVHGLIKDHKLTLEIVEQIMWVVGAIDTLLIVVAVIFLPRPSRLPRVSSEGRALAWVGAFPVLGIMLGLNFAYTWLLHRAIGIEPNPGGAFPFSVSVFLLICVLPAIVEELFFRYLALGTLRRYMGLHGAVVVSSVMFGMGHVGQPLGIPFLILLGMGLGYMRVASRGLALPMLMHFAHNLVVLLVASGA